MFKFVPLFECNFQLIVHPPRSLSFELWVEIALVLGGVLWHCMGITIALVFCTIFASRGIVFFFVALLPPSALRSAVTVDVSLIGWWGRRLWHGRGWWSVCCLFVNPASTFAPASTPACILAVGWGRGTLCGQTVGGETRLLLYELV